MNQGVDSIGDGHGQDWKYEVGHRGESVISAANKSHLQTHESPLPDEVQLNFSLLGNPLLHPPLPGKHLEHTKRADSFGDDIDSRVRLVSSAQMQRKVLLPFGTYRYHPLCLEVCVELGEEARDRQSDEHDEHADQGTPAEDAVQEDDTQGELDGGVYEDERKIATCPSALSNEQTYPQRSTPHPLPSRR